MNFTYYKVSAVLILLMCDMYTVEVPYMYFML